MKLTVYIIQQQERWEDIEVDPSTSVEDLMNVVEALSGIPRAEQFLKYNDRPFTDLQGNTLASKFKRLAGDTEDVSIQEGGILSVQRKQRRPPQQNEAQSRQQQQSMEQSELLRQNCLGSAEILDQIKRSYPELANAVNDPQRFNQLWVQVAQRSQREEAEKQRLLERLNDDPFDVESQQKIEEIIKQENIRNNMEMALEQIPETFVKTTMLYVPVIVNGTRIKAFVDSGAQGTIMSADCAERAGLTRLIDTRYAGVAKGVGTAPILGRVGVAILSIGNVALHCSFTVMAGKDVDLLLGLDTLKRHQACINLKKNVLEIADVEVPFLPDNEIPGGELLLGDEPTVDGPDGVKIGARSGAVVGPGGSSAAQGAGQATSSTSSTSAHPLPPTPASAAQRTAPPSGTPQPARQVPPGRAGQTDFPGGFSRADVDAVMNIAGVSEGEAVQALRAAGGDINGAASMFFGD